MKRAIIVLGFTLAFAAVLALGIIYFLSVHSGAPHPGAAVVGVWMGIDEYRHEHYFEFHEDGTLTWWDRDRAHDGSFSQRGPFKGRYKRTGNTVVAETGGFPLQPLGTLTLISANELKQDGIGHTMRHFLVYRRVDPK
jgi:hypothetical protein